MQITMQQLIETAKQAEAINPIEWGELSVKEDTVYEIYAKALYAAYQNTTAETRDLVLLASLVKLQVETYALSEMIALQSKTISELRKK